MPTQFSNSNSPASVLHGTNLYWIKIISAANTLSLYRHGTDTHHRKCMSRDCYPLLCYVTVSAQAARALLSNGPSADTKKKHTILLRGAYVGTCSLDRCLAILWANRSQYIRLSDREIVFYARTKQTSHAICRRFRMIQWWLVCNSYSLIILLKRLR
jgi:hypothetical protein